LDVVTAITGKISRLLEGARFENHSSGEGVVVTSIAPNSNAGYSGLRQGDIIIGANRQRVIDLDSFRKALSGNYQQLLLHINRNGYVFYLVIR
jgi:S1-C subfamily serine protease